MKLFKKLITPLLGVLLLTSCSSMSEGVSIGDKDFSINQIQQSVDQILESRKTVDTSQMNNLSAPELLRGQAQFFIASEIFNQIAVDLGIKVTPSDIASRRSEIINSLGGESKLPAALVGANLAASDLDTNLRTLIISERMQSEYINSGGSETEYFSYLQKMVVNTAKKLGVKVNPKYGKWNSETASIDASNSTDGAVTGLP
jgi:hypothetical protein